MLLRKNVPVVKTTVGLDDEARRTFQATGLAEAMLRDMIQNVPLRMYTASKKCFAEILPATREFGWCRRNLFSQPLGEATLRQGLKRFAHVQLHLGTELLGLTQDVAGVVATLRDAQGSQTQVHAQYCVACDGARSSVREMLALPFAGKTHPAKVRQLLGQHVADSDKLHIIRARVYTHNSRVAGSFVVQRVCLAGDAAHITPPWIGQGLNAGLRDAFNLAWKLAWITQGRLQPEWLQSYHDERHAHAHAMIDLADLFGAMLSLCNPFLAWLRDVFFLTIRHIPSLRDWVLLRPDRFIAAIGRKADAVREFSALCDRLLPVAPNVISAPNAASGAQPRS